MTKLWVINSTTEILDINNTTAFTPDADYEPATKKYVDDILSIYKYSIERTVTSWNITITLKNYNWDTPTTTTPIKIMIWDTIRTITSALSITINAWTNYFNSWSSELATQEIDYFCYLWWNTWWSGNWVKLIISRIPYATLVSNFTISSTNEKWVAWSNWIDWVSTDKVVNIWRFNAILSSWTTYTWSVPTTSYIINRPIFETKFLKINSILTWVTSSNVTFLYKIIGDKVTHIFDISWTWSTTNFTFTLPFSPTILAPDFPLWLVYDNWTAKTTIWRATISWNTTTCYTNWSNWAWTASWTRIVRWQFECTIF